MPDPDPAATVVMATTMVTWHVTLKVLRVWNFGLAVYSLFGAVICVPCLLFSPYAGVISAGFYPSICSHPINGAHPRVPLVPPLYHPLHLDRIPSPGAQSEHAEPVLAF